MEAVILYIYCSSGLIKEGGSGREGEGGRESERDRDG